MEINLHDIQLNNEQRELLAGTADRLGIPWDVVLNTMIAPLATAAETTNPETANGGPMPEWLDVECHARAESISAEPVCLDALRTQLQKIPGSMSGVVNAERDRR